MAKTHKKVFTLDRLNEKQKKALLIGGGAVVVAGLAWAAYQSSRGSSTPPPGGGTGTGTADVTGTVKDSSGTPVSGAVVVIDNVSSQPSDTSGGYSIQGLAAGTATVICSVYGYQEYSKQWTLDAGSNTIDIVLTPGTPTYAGSVAGEVTDETDSSPISGALVTLSLIDTSQSVGTNTAGDGTFSFSAIETGVSVHWACSASGYNTAEGDITILSTGTTPLDIQLTPASPYDGSPFSYSNVSVVPYNNYANMGDWDAPDFKATITNNSSAPANHQIKMMFERLYNGAVDLPPTQAYSNPSSLELGPGESYNFEDNFWNPLRGAYDWLMYPQAGVVYQFWLEDENGNKSEVVSTQG